MFCFVYLSSTEQFLFALTKGEYSFYFIRSLILSLREVIVPW